MSDFNYDDVDPSGGGRAGGAASNGDYAPPAGGEEEGDQQQQFNVRAVSSSSCHACPFPLLLVCPPWAD